MEIQSSDDGNFALELTESELEAVQSGLRETLEALEDWEFETRTGFTREEMRSILSDLIAKKKTARNGSACSSD